MKYKVKPELVAAHNEGNCLLLCALLQKQFCVLTFRSKKGFQFATPWGAEYFVCNDGTTSQRK